MTEDKAASEFAVVKGEANISQEQQLAFLDVADRVLAAVINKCRILNRERPDFIQEEFSRLWHIEGMFGYGNREDGYTDEYSLQLKNGNDDVFQGPEECGGSTVCCFSVDIEKGRFTISPDHAGLPYYQKTWEVSKGEINLATEEDRQAFIAEVMADVETFSNVIKTVYYPLESSRPQPAG